MLWGGLGYMGSYTEVFWLIVLVYVLVLVSINRWIWENVFRSFRFLVIKLFSFLGLFGWGFNVME